MEKTEKKTKTDKVADAINLLAEAIKSLEQKIEEKLTQQAKKEEVVVPVNTNNDTGLPSDNFPQEFRTIINERLNHKFKAKVVYRSDGMFELHIFVPKEYSNASEPQWALNKQDLRMKVIENAMGEIGVREWVDKIAENLGQEIMMRVHDDAAKYATV